MSNLLYPLGKQSILDNTIDWADDTVKVVLLTEDYTYDAAHQFLSDIPASSRVSISTGLLNKTDLLGVADADDIDLLAVTGPNDILYIVVYKDTGVEATSPLIVYVDTAPELPRTPDGSDITITWAANGVFSL